jgi:hypothetical protein
MISYPSNIIFETMFKADVRNFLIFMLHIVVCILLCALLNFVHLRTNSGTQPPPLQSVPTSFPGEKWQRRDVILPPPSNAEVKERIELHLYSPSGHSWPVLGQRLPLLINLETNVRSNLSII